MEAVNTTETLVPIYRDPQRTTRKKTTLFELFYIL